MQHSTEQDNAKKRLAQTDIAIIGAGPAGLCCALSLADLGLKILLIEKQTKDILAAPAYDGREIALTHLSQSLMDKIGVWKCIPQDNIARIKDAKVLNGDSDYTLHFSYLESGSDHLGYMVANNIIRKAAYEAAMQHDNISIKDKCEVIAARSQNDRASIDLIHVGKMASPAQETIEAKLIIAADSRFSKLRDMFDIPFQKLDFKRTCIVCRMETQNSHDDTAYECFHYDRTLAVLPLNGNAVSAVITIDSDKANDILNMDKTLFGQDIANRINNRFGNMTLISDLHSYPLISTYADSFCANRLALIGDAAVGMHPVTAHGFNLGLRGADSLAHEIKQALITGQDIGGQLHLRRYHRQHRKDTKPMYMGTNALVQLYTKNSAPARLARHTLLRMGNNIGIARRIITDKLTEKKQTQQQRSR